MLKQLSSTTEDLLTSLLNRSLFTVVTLFLLVFVPGCGFNLRRTQDTPNQWIMVKRSPLAFLTFVEKNYPFVSECHQSQCTIISDVQDTSELSPTQQSSQIRFLTLKTQAFYGVVDDAGRPLMRPRRKEVTEYITQNLNTLRADETVLASQREKLYDKLVQEIVSELQTSQLRRIRKS